MTLTSFRFLIFLLEGYTRWWSYVLNVISPVLLLYTDFVKEHSQLVPFMVKKKRVYWNHMASLSVLFDLVCSKVITGSYGILFFLTSILWSLVLFCVSRLLFYELFSHTSFMSYWCCFVYLDYYFMNCSLIPYLCLTGVVLCI